MTVVSAVREAAEFQAAYLRSKLCKPASQLWPCCESSEASTAAGSDAASDLDHGCLSRSESSTTTMPDSTDPNLQAASSLIAAELKHLDLLLSINEDQLLVALSMQRSMDGGLAKHARVVSVSKEACLDDILSELAGEEGNQYWPEERFAGRARQTGVCAFTRSAWGGLGAPAGVWRPFNVSTPLASAASSEGLVQMRVVALE